jgi:magnesium transporter
MTVRDAFDWIRKVGTDMETIYTCYVTDDQRRLEGVISVRQLLLHPYEAKIGDLMEDEPIFVHTGDDQEKIAQLFQKYDMLTLPVVDSEKRLVGIITIDDAVDVIQDENTEDIEKMAAILPGDKPYLRTSVFELWKRRIPWLLLLMISATFTGKIITSFEDKLAAYIVLTAYIPMLMDTGGNCGSQASVTIIRGISPI